jgi:hypothetical protein
MKKRVSLIFVLVAVPSFSQSNYGLSCYGDSCASVDQKAEQRMAGAKSICESGNSEVSWRKNSKPSATEMRYHWQNIHSSSLLAERGYILYTDCGHADLIVKIEIDTMYERVSLEVTDSESGEAVFRETRDIHDEESDLTHMAEHFHQASINAKAAVEEARRAQERAAREQQRQADVEAAARRCHDEYETIKQTIDSHEDAQKQIDDHNARCSNQISVELVEKEEKAEANARLEQSLREKREADLGKEKTDAFTAYTHIIADAPFAPPTVGWAHEVGLGTDNWYIVLPKTGFTNDCHFGLDRQHPVLDCLGAVGRNDYVPVVDNGRWYLLKVRGLKRAGELAATVKDGGTTLCLRQSGCYHVLAEVRQVPTSLPDKFQVPTPSTTLASYANDYADFGYPQNWKVEEKKNKEGTVVQWNVAPPEGHLGNWTTHGFFLIHVLKMSNKYPQTLDGAYEQFSTFEHQRGLTLTEAKGWTSRNVQGKIATYTSASVLDAGESGWVVVAKDKGEGYYCVMMFYPSNDDGHLYGQTFNEILGTFKLKK